MKVGKINCDKETATQRKRRLSKKCIQYKIKRSSETFEERMAHLEVQRSKMAIVRANETAIEKKTRMCNDKLRKSKNKNRTSGDVSDFQISINTFSDQICDVCTKRCYPNQIGKWRVNVVTAPYMPVELVNKNDLTICYRCRSYVSKFHQSPTPKAFWNNLQPGTIPEELLSLSKLEERLLARVIHI